ncbi:MAG TPA: ABC-F family ATP-binding cassette domain-containing protein [Rickettsiales bacterium]|nr:ABC-F family ATP-binding cassette domain-containing protein [Rickettsiales bacterium]
MLKVENLSISFGGKNVFDDINFIVGEKEKVGLIGRNGSGKTTLFKILCGKIKEYEGEIVIPKGYKIGYLEQHLNFTQETVIEEACLALPDYKKEATWDAEKVLSELGFSEEEKLKSPNEFSGGWQIRLNLAKLLISEPDILLLDEPTNYLDILSIRWLKGFLKNYKGSIMLITHDRSFMDEIITHTIIIHRGSSIKITGNTQDMYDKIATDEETYEKSRLNENKKRAQVQKFIDRFRYKSTLASRVQSRVKMLDKQEQKTELSDIQDLEFKFKYQNFVGNSNMFEAENIGFGYSQNEFLFKNLSFKIQKGDRICVVGKNGKGKSTLLKLITEELKVLEGKIITNTKTEIGYFGQTNINTLNPNHTIEQELQSVDILIPKPNIMRIAGTMMFSGDLSQKRISVLSGGEKSRVLLGKILLKTCNLLILDEPTNHLDMESCEALMEALESFEGASVIVSHNEYLLNNIANKLIVFDNGKAFLFEGNYQSFLEKIGWESEEKKEEKIKKQKVEEKPKNNKKEKEKLENLIIEKEVLMEELLKKQDYKGYGLLAREVEELTAKLNLLN